MSLLLKGLIIRLSLCVHSFIFQDFYVSSGAPETVQARKAIFRVRSWDIPE